MKAEQLLLHTLSSLGAHNAENVKRTCIHTPVSQDPVHFTNRFTWLASVTRGLLFVGAIFHYLVASLATKPNLLKICAFNFDPSCKGCSYAND